MKKILFPFILVMSLAACSHQDAPVPVYQSVAPVAAPAAAPVIVNAAPASSGASDMLAGAAMGYMLGSSTARQAAPVQASTSSTTINKTVINKTVVVKQAPSPRPAPVAPAVVSLAKASPAPAVRSYRTSTASYAPARSYKPSVSYSGMRK